MERGMKIHTTTVGLLCLTTLTIGGCVASSTYDVAVADLEATQAELKIARTQSELLTEQVRELERSKRDLARQMEDASSALQQAQQEMDAERIATQERLRKLNQTISQLTAQQNGLRYGLKRATEEQAKLQSAVDRYNPTTGEADGLRSSLFPSPIAPTNGQAGTALAPSAPAPVPLTSQLPGRQWRHRQHQQIRPPLTRSRSRQASRLPNRSKRAGCQRSKNGSCRSGDRSFHSRLLKKGAG